MQAASVPLMPCLALLLRLQRGLTSAFKMPPTLLSTSGAFRLSVRSPASSYSGRRCRWRADRPRRSLLLWHQSIMVCIRRRAMPWRRNSRIHVDVENGGAAALQIVGMAGPRIDQNCSAADNFFVLDRQPAAERAICQRGAQIGLAGGDHGRQGAQRRCSPCLRTCRGGDAGFRECPLGVACRMRTSRSLLFSGIHRRDGSGLSEQKESRACARLGR